MRNLVKLPICFMFLIVLVSCTTDSSSDQIYSVGNPVGVNNDGNAGNVYFGFLDGGGSSDNYIDMPIESSSTDLMIGRWKITKLGIDEKNDGNVKYYNYQDFQHIDCGLSFLQFNNNGVVFENVYYKGDYGGCTFFSEMDTYELLENGMIKNYVYNNIYLVNVTQSELILKYDWNFENSLWGPIQVYYFYERIVAPI